MDMQPVSRSIVASIFLGILGSIIIWYDLKDRNHTDAPKMIKKGWVIGIVLTVLFCIAWISLMLLPMAFV